MSRRSKETAQTPFRFMTARELLDDDRRIRNKLKDVAYRSIDNGGEKLYHYLTKDMTNYTEHKRQTENAARFRPSEGKPEMTGLEILQSGLPDEEYGPTQRPYIDLEDGFNQYGELFESMPKVVTKKIFDEHKNYRLRRKAWNNQMHLSIPHGADPISTWKAVDEGRYDLTDPAQRPYTWREILMQEVGHDIEIESEAEYFSDSEDEAVGCSPRKNRYAKESKSEKRQPDEPKPLTRAAKAKKKAKVKAKAWFIAEAATDLKASAIRKSWIQSQAAAEATGSDANLTTEPEANAAVDIAAAVKAEMSAKANKTSSKTSVEDSRPSRDFSAEPQSVVIELAGSKTTEALSSASAEESRPSSSVLSKSQTIEIGSSVPEDPSRGPSIEATDNTSRPGRKRKLTSKARAALEAMEPATKRQKRTRVGPEAGTAKLKDPNDRQSESVEVSAVKASTASHSGVSSQTNASQNEADVVPTSRSKKRKLDVTDVATAVRQASVPKRQKLQPKALTPLANERNEAATEIPSIASQSPPTDDHSSSITTSEDEASTSGTGTLTNDSSVDSPSPTDLPRYYSTLVSPLIIEWQEENFHTRPAVRIHTPDTIKAILVDDWEYITKNGQLVDLPTKIPVNQLLDEYYEEEKPKRRAGSADADLLEEVIAGVKEYFDVSLGRILLYKYERYQYSDVRKKLGEKEWEGKGVGDMYGAEHLARLIVSMPELIAQTNMDQQAISRLREEMTKLTAWLAKNSNKYFVGEYKQPDPDYVEKARANSN